MTPQEILDELERFKDRVNADGKATIDRLKDALGQYLTPKDPEVKNVEKSYLKVEEKVVPAPGDRREEPRDPTEHDQHIAEDMGLTPRRRRDAPTD